MSIFFGPASLPVNGTVNIPQTEVPLSLETPVSSPEKMISAASTNSVALKNVPTTLTFFSAFNNSNNVRYVKLYDKATTPIIGVDVPKQVYMLPKESGFVLPGLNLKFVNGLGICMVGGIADNNSIPVGSNEICVSYSCKE